MAPITARDIAFAAACTAIALLPWAIDGRPNGYSVVAGALLAGLLLGMRAVAVVFVVCVGVALGALVDLQLDPPVNTGGDGDGRWLFIYFCLTAIPVVLSCVAAAGALVRWLVMRARGGGLPSSSPRAQAAVGWSALAVLIAGASWSSESLVLLLGLPIVAWFASRRRHSAQ
ncbi:MAG TPA: hypothetical protein VJT75_19735 [Thermoleophilaceae bacterium]|nr:hypothetical protein [Thermoleophilaceae bacterium]